MNNEWLTAFVLHRRPYRETSYIVDFFTLQEGKISAVAKGVKNSKSDRKSLLQPFQPLNVQLAGKSDLKNLLFESTYLDHKSLFDESNLINCINYFSSNLLINFFNTTIGGQQ